MVVPFADQCKAELIVKEYEAKERAKIRHIMLYGITYEEQWLKRSLGNELDNLFERAGNELKKARDLTPSANDNLIAGINRVMEATRVEIMRIYESHRIHAREYKFRREITSAVSNFTNKEESERLLPTLTDTMAQLVALGPELNTPYAEERLTEMKRRAGQSDPEDSDEVREAKTLAYVLNMKKPRGSLI